MAKMIQEVQEIIEKEPIRKIKDFLDIRIDANRLIRLSGHIEEVAKAIGMSRQSLHRRLSDPKSWEPEELLIVFKHFGIKS